MERVRDLGAYYWRYFSTFKLLIRILSYPPLGGGPGVQPDSLTLTREWRADPSMVYSKVDKIRNWTVQKGKVCQDATQRAMQTGFRRAKGWTDRYRKDGNLAAQKAISNSIDNARYVGAKTRQTVQGTLDKAGRNSEEKKKKKGERSSKKKKRERQLISSVEVEESVGESLCPEDPQWVSPQRIAIRVIRPLPPHLQSLDVPVPSSVKSYKNCTYFPETDTHYVPAGRGGPFEVLATGAESLKWLKPYPEQYWVFRSSALRELKQTGRLHWRETDRWGVPWEESRWNEDARPIWDPEKKTWDRSMMDL